jgi:6-phosphogluconolactonase
MSQLRISLAAFMLLTMITTNGSKAANLWVYFGTQSHDAGAGISDANFDTDTGALTKPRLVIPADGPSFFALAPDGKHLYTTNYTGDGGASAYQLDPGTGALTLINRLSGGGAGSSHISLDNNGHFALVANFAVGHVAVFPIKPDGGLGDHVAFDKNPGSSINPTRQKATYPHCMMADPTNRFVLVPDLGLDKLLVYRFNDKDGTLTANVPPAALVTPGSGPRHVRFHPNGKWVYLITEMGSSIIAFDWDSAQGTLKQFQSVSTLPQGFAATSTAAEIEIHPNGKFLYGSNRGDDSIVIFAIDQSTGKLTLVDRVSSQGKTPRDFAVDPTGKWMLCTNQDSNTAIVFKIDSETGKLAPAGKPIDVPAPCGLCYVPVVVR